jgi:AAHS family 4-hydroxybenzoate transporter-like MFS transporter
MKSVPVVNVTRLIDAGSFGRLQWVLAAWCAVLAVFDGLDNAAIAYAAPVIAPLWGVPVSRFGTVFGAGLVGSMVGSLTSGILADRYGRKLVILASTFIFGLFALITARAASIEQLYILRFITGLGLGGLIPNVLALTAEYAPARIRYRVVSIMSLGFPLGAGAGGFLGAAIVPGFGWQSLFLVGGAVPLVLLPFAHRGLCESIRFLVASGRQTKQISAVLNRVFRDAAFNHSQSFVIDEEPVKGFTVRQLFIKGRAPNTLLLWVVFFCNMIVLFFLNNWLPSILREAGVPLASAFRLTGVIPWSGIIAAALLAAVVDRIGALRVLTALYLGAAAFVTIIGGAGGDVPLLWLGVSGAGACIVGGLTFINSVAAGTYSTPMRSTGIGWAFGVGRIGAILGPVIGGMLLAAHFNPKALFYGISAPALLAATATYALGRRLHRHQAALHSHAMREM